MHEHNSVRITIASDVDYERLTAGIFIDNEFVASDQSGGGTGASRC